MYNRGAEITMTDRTFKVGDVITIDDAIELGRSIDTKTYVKYSSMSVYGMEYKRARNNFKLKIVELPEVD